MKDLILSAIMLSGFIAFLFALYPKAPYTPGLGYLEEDRAALTAIIEEICGDNAGRYDCGFSPAILPPPKKPMRG